MNEHKTSEIYEANKSLVERILREVSSYSIGKIGQVLGQSGPTGISDELQKSWRRFTEQICYDRSYCNLLKVDYAGLPEQDIKDINKIKVAALYLAEENPDMILPLL